MVGTDRHSTTTTGRRTPALFAALALAAALAFAALLGAAQPQQALADEGASGIAFEATVTPIDEASADIGALEEQAAPYMICNSAMYNKVFHMSSKTEELLFNIRNDKSYSIRYTVEIYEPDGTYIGNSTGSYYGTSSLGTKLTINFRPNQLVEGRNKVRYFCEYYSGGSWVKDTPGTFYIYVTDKWKRVAGANRFETALKVSQTAFGKGKASWAIIATGRDFPDALAASSLAGARKAPVILVDGKASSLDSATKNELNRLGVKNVYVMGTSKSVSNGIATSLKKMGISVKRFAGANRVETSVMAAKEVKKVAGSKATTVIITTATDFPDTLSISPWAYAKKAPIILAAGKAGLSTSGKAAIKAGKYKKAVVVSTNGAVADVVDDQLRSAGVTNVKWIEGTSAYNTNGKVVAWEFSNGLTAKYPVVATAKGFADALGGSALAGSKKSVIVLADSASAPGVSILKANKAKRVQGYVLGGESTISAKLMSQIASATGGKVAKV